MMFSTTPFTIPADWINRPINITMVGAGGTGSALLTELFQLSYLLEQLSNGEVYLNVILYDGDTVSQSNVGRQGFWATDVGLPKASTLVSRFNAFGQVNWLAVDKMFTVHDLSRQTDLLITCVDSAMVRSSIATQLTSRALWLDTGNDRDSGQVVLGQLCNQENKLIPNVFDLYPSLANIEDKPEDSCSHEQALAKQDFGINKKVALEAAGLVWQLLRYGKIERHGSFINIADGTTHPLPISKDYWAMLGYQSQTQLQETCKLKL